MNRFDPDFFSGTTDGITEFTVATLFETDIRSGEEVFKYEETMLRPRHIIKIAYMFENMRDELEDHIIFAGKSPNVIIDGKLYQAKTIRTQSFNELVEAFVRYLSIDQEYHGFYSLTRMKIIDADSFNASWGFNLRAYYPVEQK